MLAAALRPMACQLVLTMGDEALEASLTDFQEHDGQPRQQFGLVSFSSVTFLRDEEADRS